ncbi:hypothetical protein ACSSS7_004936 [Eimeria intestinalis]
MWSRTRVPLLSFPEEEMIESLLSPPAIAATATAATTAAAKAATAAPAAAAAGSSKRLPREKAYTLKSLTERG